MSLRRQRSSGLRKSFSSGPSMPRRSRHALTGRPAICAHATNRAEARRARACAAGRGMGAREHGREGGEVAPHKSKCQPCARRQDVEWSLE